MGYEDALRVVEEMIYEGQNKGESLFSERQLALRIAERSIIKQIKRMRILIDGAIVCPTCKNEVGDEVRCLVCGQKLEVE